MCLLHRCGVKEVMTLHCWHQQDNISPMILKELVDEITTILRLIFKRSYDTGMVPT